MSAQFHPDPASRIDPWHAAWRRQGLAGEAAEQDLPRLGGALRSLGGSAQWPAHFDLWFERDAEGRALVAGRVALGVHLVCQRCLEEVRIGLETPVAVALLQSEAQAEGLPERWEPVLVGEDGVRPLDLVEDELLLILPLVPLHAAGDCEPPVVARAAATIQVESRDNPFAALAQLQVEGGLSGQDNDD